MASFLGHQAALVAVAVAMMIILGGGGEGIRRCRAEGVHHKVGGDHGWDAGTDIAAWSASRFFRAGDNIWFAYSAMQDGIAELGSREEFEACDLSNPIRMYTGGLHKVTLNGEGPRYFSSSKLNDCKNGLKLHVHVLPMEAEPAGEQAAATFVAQAVAAGPKPSGSSRICAASPLVWIAFPALYLMCFRRV